MYLLPLSLVAQYYLLPRSISDTADDGDSHVVTAQSTHLAVGGEAPVD